MKSSAGLPVTSAISWSTSTAVFVRGKSLTEEVLGHMGLAEFAWLEITGRQPTAVEARLFEAMVISLVEHGVNWNVAASRLTYAGAPESLQGAVAAGILGIGTVAAGSMEGASQMLYEALEVRGESTVDELARETVRSRAGSIIPGVGHPFHKPVDPRAERLFALAAESEAAGPYVDLMKLISVEAGKAKGRPLPVNVTGAIAAICCELGLPARIARGIPIIGRTIGLVAHLLEEQENPIGPRLKRPVERPASANTDAAPQLGET